MERLRAVARLSAAGDFQRVLRQGKRLRSPNLEIFWLSSAEPPQLGMIVGRRVGNAVKRNFLKRRMREWFRRRQKELPSGQWIFKPHPSAATLKTAELWDELTRAVLSVTRRR